MFTRVIFFVLFVVPQAWGQGRCEDLFSYGQVQLERQALVEVDLSLFYAQEIAGKTLAEIAEMNTKTIESIINEVPEKQSASRSAAITDAEARTLLNLTLGNPVAKPGNPKYDQPGVSIGYCFGRATFVHLMLLKMGVQKVSIRKIWAVGPMKAGEVTWQFHVATMAFSETQGWLVIDTNHSKPIPVQDWIAHYAKQSEDGRLRFYATDANKFAFQLGKYSRMQMGLDLNKDKDWYRHYFKDMLNWVSGGKKSDRGLMSETWRSVVEFLR